jgi:hypothetical protein
MKGINKLKVKKTATALLLAGCLLYGKDILVNATKYVKDGAFLIYRCGVVGEGRIFLSLQ